jgi:uncharacterized protein (DUF2249 family)
MIDRTIQTVIDARTLPSCQERHAAIFNTFDNLSEGEALEVNIDHDPRPLKGKFEEQRTGRFTWDYLEAGPVVWRVRIGRI